MKSKYSICDDVVCPFLNKCVLAEENPGKPFPCGLLDDIDWGVSTTIFLNYHIQKAHNAVQATGLELNDDESMTDEYADLFEEMLEKVMYLNPD